MSGINSRFKKYMKRARANEERRAAIALIASRGGLWINTELRPLRLYERSKHPKAKG